MPAVMPEDGQLLLFFPQRDTIIIEGIQLFLELEVLLFQPEHFLYLLEAALDGKDQEQSHQHQHTQGDQSIDLEGRLEQLVRIQDKVPLVGMVITQQQRHRSQIGPESRPGRSQLFRGEKPPDDFQGQGHPQQEQKLIDDKIRQHPVALPRLRQEQFEHFQRQGMDEEHINGLEPQYEQMPEPKGPDGQHQQEQVGQVAEKVHKLEHAAFHFQEAPAEQGS